MFAGPAAGSVFAFAAARLPNLKSPLLTCNLRGGIFMAWLYLLVAGLFEIGWAVGLKYTEGFTRLWPSVWTGACLVVSMILLAAAVRELPIGTAYAVWTGIGAVGTALLGILLFGEPRDAARLLCIALIVAGILGLKLVSPH